MTTYTVTAGNQFYWQTLAVDATTAAEASEKFTAYLAAPQQQADEKYEYDEEVKLDGEDAEQPIRSDYAYDFDADQIEEDDAIKATATVEMLRSGGNG